MEQCRTAGCIPFRHTPQGEVELLMVLNDAEDEGHWEFPKGKLEEGESAKEAALRELEEETGLTGVLLDAEAIEIVFDCVVRGHEYHKTVTYYYCRVPDNAEVRLEEDELKLYAWLCPEEIVERATYESMKSVAQAVQKYFASYCGQ